MIAISILKTVDFFIASVSCLISFVIIITYCHDKELRRLPSNAFLINFMITNLLHSSAALLMSSVEKSTDFKQEAPEFFIYSSYFTFSVVSYALSLAIVTVDRYWAVIRPFNYAANMDCSRAKRILCIFWSGITIFGVVTMIAALVTSKEKKIVLTVLLVITLLVALLVSSSLVLVNSKILCAVRRQVRRLISSSSEHGEKMRHDLAKRQARSAYLCIGMVLTFLLCWLPNAMSILFLLTRLRIDGLDIFPRITLTLYFICLIINPIWYIFWKTDFQQALRRIFTRVLCCSHLNSSIRKPATVMPLQELPQIGDDGQARQ